MQFKTLEAEHDGRKFVIEEDFPEVGSYLFVYEGDMCVKDYLQNDIEICKLLALEIFKVPLDKWVYR